MYKFGEIGVGWKQGPGIDPWGGGNRCQPTHQSRSSCPALDQGPRRFSVTTNDSCQTHPPAWHTWTLQEGQHGHTSAERGVPHLWPPDLPPCVEITNRTLVERSLGTHVCVFAFFFFFFFLETSQARDQTELQLQPMTQLQPHWLLNPLCRDQSHITTETTPDP